NNGSFNLSGQYRGATVASVDFDPNTHKFGSVHGNANFQTELNNNVIQEHAGELHAEGVNHNAEVVGHVLSENGQIKESTVREMIAQGRGNEVLAMYQNYKDKTIEKLGQKSWESTFENTAAALKDKYDLDISLKKGASSEGVLENVLTRLKSDVLLSFGVSDTGGIRSDGNKKFEFDSCFVAGTLVRTKEGFKPIEKIRVGEYVLSHNENTGKLSFEKVTETFIHDVPLIHKITYTNGTTVETTWNHPFYVKGQGWTQVKDLQPANRSVTLASIQNTAILSEMNARQIPIGASLTSVSNATNHAPNWSETYTGTLGIRKIEEIRRQDRVYNLEVEGNHSYFITKAGVLVHNYNLDAFLKRAAKASYEEVTGLSKDPQKMEERKSMLEAESKIFKDTGEQANKTISDLVKSKREYSTDEKKLKEQEKLLNSNSKKVNKEEVKQEIATIKQRMASKQYEVLNNLEKLGELTQKGREAAEKRNSRIAREERTIFGILKQRDYGRLSEDLAKSQKPDAKQKVNESKVKRAQNEIADFSEKFAKYESQREKIEANHQEFSQTKLNDTLPDKLAKFYSPTELRQEWSKKNIDYLTKIFKNEGTKYRVDGERIHLEKGVINTGVGEGYQYSDFKGKTEVLSYENKLMSGGRNDNLKESKDLKMYTYTQDGRNVCQTYSLLDQLIQAGVMLRNSGRSPVEELAHLERDMGLTAEMSTNMGAAYDKILDKFGLKAVNIVENKTTPIEKLEAIKQALKEGKMINAGMYIDGPRYDASGNLDINPKGRPVKPDGVDYQSGHRVTIIGYDDVRGEWIVRDSNKTDKLVRYKYGEYLLGMGNYNTIVVKKR
ncbi:intein C-terminal splicing domain protein, partial [Leptospira inadai serovar Lyme str. 10]